MQKKQAVDPLVMAQRRAWLGRLYMDHAPSISGFLARRLQGVDQGVIEDLTADVFEHALGAVDRFVEGDAPVSAWLFKIAQNLLTDYYRSRAVRDARRSGVPLEQVESKVAIEVGLDPSVRAALDLLPEVDRRIVLLHWGERWSVAKIAAHEGLTRTRTEKILRKAVGLLRKELEEETRGVVRFRLCSGLDALAATILAGHFDQQYPFPYVLRQRKEGQSIRKRLFMAE